MSRDSATVSNNMVDEHASRGAVEVVEHGEPLVHVGEIGADLVWVPSANVNST